MTTPKPTRYDAIGAGYAARRREDSRIAARLWSALGDARSIVNVGAGTGSYEPLDREVIPVEPSAVMAAQRPPTHAPAVEGRAEMLPLGDGSVDAAMAVLTLHHWDDQAAGLDEMRRVARDRIALLVVDPVVASEMWLIRDYLVEVSELDRSIMPSPEWVAERIGGTVEVVPVPADCADGMLLAFWAHPEWVLDPAARAATSGFARMPDEVVDRVVADVARDLANGAWDARYGRLRELDELDAGLRLVVAEIA